jgi:hypothetical protein
MKDENKNKNRFPIEMLLPFALVLGVLYFVFGGKKSTPQKSFNRRPIKSFM